MEHVAYPPYSHVTIVEVVATITKEVATIIEVADMEVDILVDMKVDKVADMIISLDVGVGDDYVEGEGDGESGHSNGFPETAVSAAQSDKIIHND